VGLHRYWRLSLGTVNWKRRMLALSMLMCRLLVSARCEFVLLELTKPGESEVTQRCMWESQYVWVWSL